MALKLSLKPGERFVVNGAVIANGDRRASIVVQNKVSILREKDIMQAEDAITPARRIYFPIMMMYIDEAGFGAYYDEFTQRMSDFLGAVSSDEGKSLCIQVSQHVMDRQYYQALLACKKLMSFEETRLSNEPSGVSARAAGN